MAKGFSSFRLHSVSLPPSHKATADRQDRLFRLSKITDGTRCRCTRDCNWSVRVKGFSSFRLHSVLRTTCVDKQCWSVRGKYGIIKLNGEGRGFRRFLFLSLCIIYAFASQRQLQRHFYFRFFQAPCFRTEFFISGFFLERRPYVWIWKWLISDN